MESKSDEQRVPVADEPAPPQFSLRTLFILTAMFAVIAAIALHAGIGGLMVMTGIAFFFVVLYGAFSGTRGVQFAASLVLIVLLLGLITGLLMPVGTGQLVVGKRSLCANNLKQLGLALLNYQTTMARFPPPYTTDDSGAQLHSWRTLLLPYIEYQSLLSQLRLNEPWNSPHNKQFTQFKLDVFHCPSDPDCGEYDTDYIAVVGPGTIWDPKGRVKT